MEIEVVDKGQAKKSIDFPAEPMVRFRMYVGGNPSGCKSNYTIKTEIIAQAGDKHRKICCRHEAGMAPFQAPTSIHI